MWLRRISWLFATKCLVVAITWSPWTPLPCAVHHRNLLVQRHLRQQEVCALVRGETGVRPGAWRPPGRRGGLRRRRARRCGGRAWASGEADDGGDDAAHETDGLDLHGCSW